MEIFTSSSSVRYINNYSKLFGEKSGCRLLFIEGSTIRGCIRPRQQFKNLIFEQETYGSFTLHGTGTRNEEMGV